MIGGEPYTLGLFDTAGKIMIYWFSGIAFIVELGSVFQCVTYDELICGVVCLQVRKIMTGYDH